MKSHCRRTRARRWACSAWLTPVPSSSKTLASFGTPDPAYVGFATDIAMDGDYALVTAGRSEPDPDDPSLTRNSHTAFLFQRSGTRWNVVRRLNEFEQIRDFRIPVRGGDEERHRRRADGAHGNLRAALRQLGSRDLGAHAEAPGRDLEIDGGRILSGDGRLFLEWSRVRARRGRHVAHGGDVAGLPRSDGCDDEFRGGPVDISGNLAVVHQPDPEDLRTFPRLCCSATTAPPNGWYLFPFASARPPEGATDFGPEVAIRGTDVFVVRQPGQRNLCIPRHDVLRLRARDADPAARRLHGRRRRARLRARAASSSCRTARTTTAAPTSSTCSAGAAISPTSTSRCWRAATAHRSATRSRSAAGACWSGNNGTGLVHYFELPTNLVPPTRVQDTFSSGNGANWSPTAGSQFATAQSGVSRVYRQSAVTGEARAVLTPATGPTSRSKRTFVPRASRRRQRLRARHALPGRHQFLRRHGAQYRRGRSCGAWRAGRCARSRRRRSRRWSIAPIVCGSNRSARRTACIIDGRHAARRRQHRAVAWPRGAVHRPRERGVRQRGGQPEPDDDHVHQRLRDRAKPDRGRTRASVSGTCGRAPRRSTTRVPCSATRAPASASPADDQIVRVRARLDTFANPTGTQERWFGVMARYSDDANYYYLSLRSSNTVALRKLVNGSISTLASAAFTVQPATWYSPAPRRGRRRLRAYVDGSLLLEASRRLARQRHVRPGDVQGRGRLRRFPSINPDPRLRRPRDIEQCIRDSAAGHFSPAFSARASR